MPRIILHSDCNGFYAAVECLYRPEIRNKPVVVGGDESLRHGVVLAANQLAKRIYKVKTGEALIHVRQRCPDLIIVKPNHKLYLRFAKLAREIYNDYTDQVEPFGLDESFIGLTGIAESVGDGERIADTIRERIKYELGITVSIGVSYTKSFAKLASDMRKPDFTTVIAPDEFRQKVWPQPVGDLIYVGAASAEKLRLHGIHTIGDLAGSKREDIISWIRNKNGGLLWDYANGFDSSVVRQFEECMNDDSGIKGFSHSTTTPRDLCNADDMKVTVMVLAEAVAARLREHKRLSKTVSLWLRDNKMSAFTRQCKTAAPTNLAYEIAETAMKLYHACYGSLGNPGSTLLPIRSVGVRASDLVREEEYYQLSFLPKEHKRQNIMAIERAMDDIRERYGHTAISRGVLIRDRALGSDNPKEDHIHTFPNCQGA
ncbi:MAG: DNA polymerase IV [Oscillospiraceae bacterium]|jgi:DNA polymerase-4|nr:DNA polymerase IV [Oscillospiraceae bacterium]